MISFSPSNYKRKSSNIKSIILNHEEIMWSIQIDDAQVLDKHRYQVYVTDIIHTSLPIIPQEVFLFAE
jgi:hypothetical protein